jgi:hypothetical protein
MSGQRLGHGTRQCVRQQTMGMLCSRSAVWEEGEGEGEIKRTTMDSKISNIDCSAAHTELRVREKEKAVCGMGNTLRQAELLRAAVHPVRLPSFTSTTLPLFNFKLLILHPQSANINQTSSEAHKAIPALVTM